MSLFVPELVHQGKKDTVKEIKNKTFYFEWPDDVIHVRSSLTRRSYSNLKNIPDLEGEIMHLIQNILEKKVGSQQLVVVVFTVQIGTFIILIENNLKHLEITMEKRFFISFTPNVL